jgi:multiple sugar transport system permease protein
MANVASSYVEPQHTWSDRLGIWYRHRRDTIVAYTFLTPMIIYFLVMTFVPLGFLIGMSLMEWNIISPPHFVGLRNIQKVLSSYNNYFYIKVIGRTIIYAVAILSLNIVGGFFVALIMNQQLKARGIFRTMWYLPSVFSGAVIALLMNQYLASGPGGIVNMLLIKIGIQAIDWRTNAFWMPVMTVLFSVWQGIGFTVIFFLAGLQSVDENLYDAAKIDGANGKQLLWYITIPQMMPMLLFISVTGMIGSMQMWEMPKMFTSGGPNYLTYTLIYSIQNDSFGALEMGMGTAQSLVLFIILLVFIGTQLNNYRKQYGV